MKKILILLTGIVFIITILVAGACSNGKTPIGLAKEEIIKDSTRVTIYLKAIEIGGEKHLQMYDSNKPDDKVVDTLSTWVVPGTKVIWKLDQNSGIKKINKIGSSKEVRNIFKNDARKRFLSKGFKLKLSDDIDGEEEKYDIEITDTDGTPWPPIDPYLRIPRKPGN